MPIQYKKSKVRWTAGRIIRRYYADVLLSLGVPTYPGEIVLAGNCPCPGETVCIANLLTTGTAFFTNYIVIVHYYIIIVCPGDFTF